MYLAYDEMLYHVQGYDGSCRVYIGYDIDPAVIADSFISEYPIICEIIKRHHITHYAVCDSEYSFENTNLVFLVIEEDQAAFAVLCGLEILYTDKPHYYGSEIENITCYYHNFLFEDANETT